MPSMDNSPTRVGRSSSGDIRQMAEASAGKLDTMKKSGMFLGGYQSKHGHASLMAHGPVAPIDPSQFFSPQHKKGGRLDYDQDVNGSE